MAGGRKSKRLERSVLDIINDHRRERMKRENQLGWDPTISEGSHFKLKGTYIMTAKIDPNHPKLASVNYYDSLSGCNREVNECRSCAIDFPAVAKQEVSDIHLFTASVDDDEAAAILNTLVAETQEDHRWLRARLKTHGNELLSRWEKKDEKKRRACLPSNLERRKYANVRFQYDDKQWPDKREKWRQSLLLPQFSAEGLLEDSARLLRLVHNRSTHDVWEFGRLDLLLLEDSVDRGFLERSFNENCVDLTGPAGYGSLVPFDATALHWRECPGYPTAVLVLEAQQYLMKTLRVIVQNVLKGLREQDGTGDKELNNRASEAFQHASQPSRILTPSGNELCFSLMDIFCGPPTGDTLQQSSSRLRHQRKLWEANMVAMQMDSVKMNERVTQLTTPPHSHPILGQGLWLNTFEPPLRWAYLAARAWETDYKNATDLYDFELLLKTLRVQSQLYVSAKEAVSSGTKSSEAVNSLHQRYATSMEELRLKFESLKNAAIECIFENLINNPGFEACYSFAKVEMLHPGTQDVEPTGDMRSFPLQKRSFDEGPLTWAILQLGGKSIREQTDYALEDVLTICMDSLEKIRPAEEHVVRKVLNDPILMSIIQHMATLFTFRWSWLLHRPSQGLFSSTEARETATRYGDIEETIVPEDTLSRPCTRDRIMATDEDAIEWVPDLSEHNPNDRYADDKALLRGSHLQTFMVGNPLVEGLEKAKALPVARKRLRKFWDSARNAHIPWYFKEQWNLPAATQVSQRVQNASINKTHPSNVEPAVAEQTAVGEAPEGDFHEGETVAARPQRASPPRADKESGFSAIESDVQEEDNRSDEPDRAFEHPIRPQGPADAQGTASQDVDIQDAQDDWQLRRPDPNEVADQIWDSYRMRLLMQDQTSAYRQACIAADALAQLEDERAMQERERSSSPRQQSPTTPKSRTSSGPNATSPISPGKRKRETDAQETADPTSPGKRQKARQTTPSTILSKLKLGARQEPPEPSPFDASPVETRQPAFVPRDLSKREKKEQARAAAAALAAEVEQAAEPEAALEPEPLPANSIPVSSKSLQVWAYLFSSESGTDASGMTVRWTNLLNAFQDAGIASARKSEGVQMNFIFAGTDVLPKGKFSFHKSHRDGENLETHVLRSYGNHVKSGLGWRWEMFTLREKESKSKGKGKGRA